MSRTLKRRLLRGTAGFAGYPIIVALMFGGYQEVRKYVADGITMVEAYDIVSLEREKLGIGDDVDIVLEFLPGSEFATTWWRGPDKPVLITFPAEGIHDSSVRHEMYHVARCFRIDYPTSQATFLERLEHVLRYYYIEDPLAIIYQATGWDLG